MATLGRFQAFALDDQGNVLTSPSVDVIIESSGLHASLFSDRAGATGIANPFTGGSDGLCAFHVIGGAYKVTITKGAVTRIFRYVPVGTAGEHDTNIDNANNTVPPSNDGATLGTASLSFSDLFLASGGVINWNAGNVTLTHSAGLLTLAGALTVTGAVTVGSLVAPVTGSAVATQSDQVTGTSTTTLVSPGRQKFNQAAVKAWGYADTAGNPTATYNISSITDNGAGDAFFNLTTGLASIGGAVATAHTDSTLITRITNSNTSSATIRVLVSNTSGTAVDPNHFGMVECGTF